MINVPSASTNLYAPFIAANTDNARQAGLTSFTVYKSLNAGTTTVWGTQVIVESGVNMPGLYWLKLDQFTTMDAGFDSQSLIIHISHASIVDIDIEINLTKNNIQTGDSYARLGSPAGVSIAADILTVDDFVDELITGACTAGTLGATTFSTDLTVTTADQYADMYIRFNAATVTPSLRNQTKKILSMTTGGVITLTSALTVSTANTDGFQII